MGWNVTGYDFCLLCRLTKQEGLLLNAAGCAFSWEPSRFVDEAGRIFFEASFMPFNSSIMTLFSSFLLLIT